MGRYRTVRSAERIGGSPARRSRTSARSPLPPNPVRAVADPDRAELRSAASDRSQAGPGPLLGSLHQTGPQRIPLDVPQNHQKVFVLLDQKGLVTPLIEMAVPDLVTMLLPPFHMRVGHLLHERGKIAIPLGPNEKMPVVGHQTVSAQPHPASSQRFLNDPLERQKVLVLGEKHSPAHASVEHVENHPPRKMSPRS